MNRDIQFQEKILRLLAGQINGFYLSGGTALSLFYFHHRQSEDLDFFTQNFRRKRIVEIMEELSKKLKKRPLVLAEQTKKDRIRMLIYSVPCYKKFLKIDFVEDLLKVLKPFKIINGINILSLEDIYLRKIYTVTGFAEKIDEIGRKVTIGSRQEPKDFYDLYWFSHTFMRLSDFAIRYCDSIRKEALIRWFRKYDRFEIKAGLTELKIKRDIDYVSMERHFKKEIDRLLEKEIDFI